MLLPGDGGLINQSDFSYGNDCVFSTGLIVVCPVDDGGGFRVVLDT